MRNGTMWQYLAKLLIDLSFEETTPLLGFVTKTIWQKYEVSHARGYGSTIAAEKQVVGRWEEALFIQYW